MGDCDSDSDCQASLVCGKDNCADLHEGAHEKADCCIEPFNITTTTGSTADLEMFEYFLQQNHHQQLR